MAINHLATMVVAPVMGLQRMAEPTPKPDRKTQEGECALSDILTNLVMAAEAGDHKLITLYSGQIVAVFKILVTRLEQK